MPAQCRLWFSIFTWKVEMNQPSSSAFLSSVVWLAVHLLALLISVFVAQWKISGGSFCFLYQQFRCSSLCEKKEIFCVIVFRFYISFYRDKYNTKHSLDINTTLCIWYSLHKYVCQKSSIDVMWQGYNLLFTHQQSLPIFIWANTPCTVSYCKLYGFLTLCWSL